MQDNFARGFRDTMQKMAAGAIQVLNGPPVDPADEVSPIIDHKKTLPAQNIPLAPGKWADRILNGEDVPGLGHVKLDLSDTTPIERMRLHRGVNIPVQLPEGMTALPGYDTYVSLPGGLASILGDVNNSKAIVTGMGSQKNPDAKHLPLLKQTKLPEPLKHNDYGWFKNLVALFDPTTAWGISKPKDDLWSPSDEDIKSMEHTRRAIAAGNARIAIKNKLIEAENRRRDAEAAGYVPTEFKVESPLLTNAMRDDDPMQAGLVPNSLGEGVLEQAWNDQIQRLRAAKQRELRDTQTERAAARAEAGRATEAELQRLRDEERDRQAVERYRKTQENPLARAAGRISDVEALRGASYPMPISEYVRRTGRRLTTQEIMELRRSGIIY